MKLKLLIIIQFAMLSLVEGQTNKTIILVHGAGHGAWCWTKIIPILNDQKINAVAIDLPSHGNDTSKLFTQTLMDDAEAVKKAANAVEGKVILVGHSSGGVVIAQAAELLGSSKVDKLIFLDAFMPQNGQSVRELAAQAMKNSKVVAMDNATPVMLFTANFQAFQWNLAIVETHFFHDCSKEDQAFAKAKLTWQATATNGTPVQVSDNIYGKMPKYYILCTEAKDLDKSSIAHNVSIKKLYQLPSSHSPFFSMPTKLADILVEIYHQK
jgi:pimeloyl-ACP methyl ester carboxylesterase